MGIKSGSINLKTPMLINCRLLSTPLLLQISVANSSRFKVIGEKLIFTSLSAEKLSRFARQKQLSFTRGAGSFMKHSSNKTINQNVLISYKTINFDVNIIIISYK